MRRLILGAAALVTGVAAAVGVALGLRRRRAHAEDVLPLEPVPPLGTLPSPAPSPPAKREEAVAAGVVSVEADFGAAAEAPARPKRRRRRKPAGAAVVAGTAEDAAVEGPATVAPPVMTEAASSAGLAEPPQPPTAAKRRRRPRRKPGEAKGTSEPTGSADALPSTDRVTGS